MFTGIQKAVHVAGTQRAIAQQLGISHQAFNFYFRGYKRLPKKYLIEIEILTGIGRHELDPELFEGYERAQDIKPYSFKIGCKRLREYREQENEKKFRVANQCVDEDENT